ncbi:MAG TPA: cytochrome c [Cyclobacteriaceae bacterium]|nr:cytochrome c [Cytophagales bacterium]HCR54621.1 cytochrome C [Cytophagales bacterium]HMR58688.1 cytochrome c [Cyclobacteriaceae bacterium]HRE66193.1 cytochrome c [Cyclobacteriaceae bacterium]HRF32116.1 cytochrome c [Cyclobacteriaceae bacterium]
MRMKQGIWGIAAVLLLAGCKAGGDYQGVEYAPNMYHSVAYEPLTQITDEGYGVWVNSLDNGRGEYYNTNKFNPFAMNMRLPAPNTVRRNANGWLPYRGANDTTGLRLSNNLVNPLADTPSILDQGKLLYDINCKHCHGAKGAGDGKVADKYPGVANLTGDAIKGVSEGHIFHVITYGKGLMGAHGSQVSEEERWKIARYVKQLQKN